MTGNTVIDVPFEIGRPLWAVPAQDTEPGDLEGGVSHRLFRIRTADTAGHRSSASLLIDRMYATRGYRTSGLPGHETPEQITLVASDDTETIGTITIGFDFGAGLLADDLFAEEIDGLRAQGRRVCEFTKLALDSAVRSKRVLASLFHMAFIHAHRLTGMHNVVIEVNPRHVKYYERMLGFKVLSPQRLNRRVNAPAVLLCLDFDHAHDCIERFGGTPECALVERSLYPYFFSTDEEAGIIGRLRRREPETSAPRRPSRRALRAVEARA